MHPALLLIEGSEWMNVSALWQRVVSIHSLILVAIIAIGVDGTVVVNLFMLTMHLAARS